MEATLPTPAPTQAALTVLIVEDEGLIAIALSEEVKLLGHAVCGLARDAAGAERLAAEHRPDVILMDVRLMGPNDGVTAALRILRHQSPAIIFCTASVDRDTRDRMMGVPGSLLLPKPVVARHLKEMLQTLQAARGTATPRLQTS